MESTVVTNLQELQSQIQLLKITEAEQKEALIQRFNNPFRIFNSVKGLFAKKYDKPINKGLLHPDIVNLVSRFIIPFTLNNNLQAIKFFG